MAEVNPINQAARDFVRTLDAFAKAAEKYADILREVGRESPEGATARGLDDHQIRRRLESELIARLCPRPIPGMPKPVFQLKGSPEARKYVGRNPLLGLK